MTPGYGYGYGYSLRPVGNQGGGAPDPGWRPTDHGVDNLAWYRSDLGVTTDGDGVNRWEDQSGNGKHALQSTGAKKPGLVLNFLNGQPAIEFDGIDDFLNLGTGWSPTTAKDYTFVCVFQLKATSPSANMYFVDTQVGRLIWGIRIGTMFGWSDGIWAEYDTPLIDTPYLYTAQNVAGAGNTKTYKNGTLMSLSGGNDTYTQKRHGNNANIGAVYNTGGTSNLDGYIMEMYVMEGGFTDGERADSDEYIDWLYPSIGVA